MTRRDLAWRAGGMVLIVLGCAPSIAPPTDDAGLASALSLAGMLVAIAGIVLAANGRRAAVALRIVRSRHRELPLLIHARRIRDPLGQPTQR